MRRNPGISQADIARATGIRPPSVVDWLNGKTLSLRLKPACKAAALFGCDPLWLGEGEGSPRWADATPAAHEVPPAPPDLAAALPVVLGRLPGLDEYTAGKVLGALQAATKPAPPLEQIEADLLQWLTAQRATPPGKPRTGT